MPIENNPLSRLLQQANVQKTDKDPSPRYVTKPLFGNDLFQKTNTGFSQAVIAELEKLYPGKAPNEAFALARKEYKAQQADDAIANALPDTTLLRYTAAFSTAKQAGAVKITPVNDKTMAIFRSIARAQGLTLIFNQNGGGHFDHQNPPISFSDALIHEFKLARRNALVTALGLNKDQSNQSLLQTLINNTTIILDNNGPHAELIALLQELTPDAPKPLTAEEVTRRNSLMKQLQCKSDVTAAHLQERIDAVNNVKTGSGILKNLADITFFDELKQLHSFLVRQENTQNATTAEQPETFNPEETVLFGSPIQPAPEKTNADYVEELIAFFDGKYTTVAQVKAILEKVKNPNTEINPDMKAHANRKKLQELLQHLEGQDYAKGTTNGQDDPTKTNRVGTSAVSLPTSTTGVDAFTTQYQSTSTTSESEAGPLTDTENRQLETLLNELKTEGIHSNTTAKEAGQKLSALQRTTTQTNMEHTVMGHNLGSLMTQLKLTQLIELLKRKEAHAATELDDPNHYLTTSMDLNDNPDIYTTRIDLKAAPPTTTDQTDPYKTVFGPLTVTPKTFVNPFGGNSDPYATKLGLPVHPNQQTTTSPFQLPDELLLTQYQVPALKESSFTTQDQAELDAFIEQFSLNDDITLKEAEEMLAIARKVKNTRTTSVIIGFNWNILLHEINFVKLIGLLKKKEAAAVTTEAKPVLASTNTADQEIEAIRNKLGLNAQNLTELETMLANIQADHQNQAQPRYKLKLYCNDNMKQLGKLVQLLKDKEISTLQQATQSLVRARTGMLPSIGIPVDLRIKAITPEVNSDTLLVIPFSENDQPTIVGRDPGEDSLRPGVKILPYSMGIRSVSRSQLSIVKDENGLTIKDIAPKGGGIYIYQQDLKEWVQLSSNQPIPVQPGTILRLGDEHYVKDGYQIQVTEQYNLEYLSNEDDRKIKTAPTPQRIGTGSLAAVVKSKPSFKLPPAHLTVLNLEQLKRVNESGFKNTFDLHFPSDSIFGTDLDTAYNSLLKAKTIFEGDMHGHTRKFFGLLAAAGLIGFKDEAQASSLFRILEDSEKINTLSFNPDDTKKLDQLCQEFEKALEGVEWIDDARGFNQLGDLVNDRGPDDRFTFILLNHLNKGITDPTKKHIKTLVGNHDLNVLAPSEAKIRPLQAKSSIASLGLMNSGATKETLALYRKFYEESLLFDYIPDIKALCSHAPLIKKDVDRLIELMNKRHLLPANIDAQSKITLGTLPQFMGEVNTFYRDVIASYFDIPAGATEPQPDTEGFALINSLTWVRSDLDDKDEMAFSHIPGLKRLHGHDSSSKESRYGRKAKQAARAAGTLTDTQARVGTVHNLDNAFGKSKLDKGTRPLFLIV